MRRVAVFGNAGGGKSTLARRLAEVTQLPLYVVDMMKFRAGGVAVPYEQFLDMHAELLDEDEWIIDGYGGAPLAWQRFAKADTLIHVDLPLITHGWRVTKRLIKGLLSNPAGWPENSPLWSSTMSSYRVLWPCHRDLTPGYRKLCIEAASTKRVHSLRTPAEMATFLSAVQREHHRDLR